MNLHIYRILKSKKYTYNIIDNNTWVGESNFTFGINLRRIKVENNCNHRIELRQTNWFLKILNMLPVLNSETFTPFYYFENGMICGKSKKLLYKSVFWFNINNINFELRQHNNNYCSLMKNGTQVALYKKDDFTVNERNSYNVMYCDEMIDSIQILLLFCIFIDIVYYSNAGRISLAKYEKNFVFEDNYPERILWNPRDTC